MSEEKAASDQRGYNVETADIKTLCRCLDLCVLSSRSACEKCRYKTRGCLGELSRDIKKRLREAAGILNDTSEETK